MHPPGNNPRTGDDRIEKQDMEVVSSNGVEDSANPDNDGGDITRNEDVNITRGVEKEAETTGIGNENPPTTIIQNECEGDGYVRMEMKPSTNSPRRGPTSNSSLLPSPIRIA